MKKISLIIPVYNVEKYVSKCILSCINQNVSSSDYEIIIINDGSTDSSLEIVNSIVENQENSIVFSQKNAGLSLTRNRGLELAQGEYIWFIDSDDWIEANCLEGIIKRLNDIDILALAYSETYDDSTKNNSTVPNAISVHSGVDLLKNSFTIPAQFYIYNKKFLKENALFFEPGLFHEDFEFTPRMLYLAKKVAVYEQQVYFYYQRSGSITTSVNPKKAFDLIKIALNLISFEKQKVKAKDKYIFHNMIWLALNNALYNTFQMNDKTQKELGKVLYENKWMFAYLSLSTILKYKIERYFFILFPKNTTLIYKLLRRLKF